MVVVIATAAKSMPMTTIQNSSKTFTQILPSLN
jgi:hypothetical protein